MFSQPCVQPGLAHVLMTSWALDFESRDYRFLAHKSGILPTLQATVTLTNTASMASSTLARLRGFSPGPEDEATVKEASKTSRQRWNPWSLENIREGFIQVIQSAHTRADYLHGSRWSVFVLVLVATTVIWCASMDVRNYVGGGRNLRFLRGTMIAVVQGVR